MEYESWPPSKWKSTVLPYNALSILQKLSLSVISIVLTAYKRIIYTLSQGFYKV
jgi:hypothetical protein